jgi:GNAT superfamily N-acetyltransferase
MTQVEIRELVDFSELCTMFPLVRQSNPELDQETFETRVAEMLHGGGYRCLGAYREGILVGIAGFWIGTALWCGRYCEPDNVVVDQASRGGGVGKALMAAIDAEANRLGCGMMKLEVYTTRHKAREFYRREGFSEPGMVMIKVLPSKGGLTMDELLHKARL